MKTKSKGVTGILAAIMFFSCAAFASCGGAETNPQSAESGGDGSSQAESSSVAEPAGMWVDKTWSYETDAEGTAGALDYYLFVPNFYNPSDELPLITWISDASGVGRDTETLLKNKARLLWTKPEKINQTPYFFLTIGFKESATSVEDEYSESGQIMGIIEQVISDYRVDENRLYLTGQSMGGIAEFMLNTLYPSTFAATYYVATQPGGSGTTDDEQAQYVLSEKKFLNQKIVYMTSMLDQKANPGEHWIIDACEEAGTPYQSLENLNYKSDTLDSQVKAVLDKGADKNFFAYSNVSTGASDDEHMATWKYAYSLDSIWNWMLSQSLNI